MTSDPARDLETADTEPSPPPDDPEARVPTWPKLRAVSLDLTTDVLENGDDVTSRGD